jgi:putative nucleotidyltransferase with HDIG domain
MDKEHVTRTITASIAKMPSLPTTVAKILQVCNNPRALPADLNQVISLDPVLMGKVLRLINSAYYSLPNQVTSLVRAIIMLGINTVKNLALSTAVLGNLGKGPASNVLNLEGFWRHSICVGVTAKRVARRRGVDPKLQEEYFAAGLLHDLGKIPLNNYLPDVYIQALEFADRDHRPLYSAETHILGMSHADVGLLVAGAWKLDRAIADGISHHHDVGSYQGDHRDVVFTVAAANSFANALEIGYSGDRHPDPVPQAVSDHLGMSWDDLEQMEDEITAEIEKAQVFLQVSR